MLFRSHSSLRGNIDTAILVEKGDIKVATTLKQKDGEDNLQVRFKLHKVVIGHDRRGKEISTCLVELTDDEPENDQMDGLTKKEKEALLVLQALVDEARIDPGTGEISDVPVMVSMNDWREALGTAGTISRDNLETARKQFTRLRSGLKYKGKIELTADSAGVAGT